jgi:hypothetical protein
VIVSVFQQKEFAVKKKWKFKKGVEVHVTTDGFWYDVTDGGYLDVEDYLVNREDVEAVKAAAALLKSLEKAMEDKGLLESN